MSKDYRFTAEIKEGARGGAYVEIPLDVEKEFGKKRVKVKAFFENVPYRGMLVRMNTECHILGVRKEIREALNKKIGDKVNVILGEDLEERTVDLPDELTVIFAKDKILNDKFEKFSYTHKKEYVNWINEAKKEETRKARVEKMITILKENK